MKESGAYHQHADGKTYDKNCNPCNQLDRFHLSHTPHKYIFYIINMVCYDCVNKK